MKKIITLYVITGTTRGLGNAFFEVLCEKNAIITINRKKITYYNNNNINLEIDLSKISDISLKIFRETLSEKLENNIQKVIFINNAFAMGTLTKIDELAMIEIINKVNVNFIASFLLIKSFIHETKNLLIEKKILNISSGAANKAIDGWSIYCTTKSAMEMLITCVNLEYPEFVCFNIDPGVMNTEMQSEIRNFKYAKNNQYFIDLYNNNELKDVFLVAKNIILKYT